MFHIIDKPTFSLYPKRGNVWCCTIKLADVVMAGNEEVKLLGMEGNRRFSDSIVAGTFFICGEKFINGEADFCSLSDELCEKYLKQFAVPEHIEPQEVENDIMCGLLFW